MRFARLFFSCILLALLFPLSAAAQWTDNGGILTTPDRVSVGTSSTSSYSLFVDGSFRARNADGDGSSYNWRVSGSGDWVFDSRSGEGNVKWFIDYANTFQIDGDGRDQDLIFDVQEQGTSLLSVAGNQRVGIGTDTPSHKLDVHGTIRARDGVNPRTGRLYQSDPLTAYPDGLSFLGSETQQGWDWLKDAGTVFTIRHPGSNARSTQFLAAHGDELYMRRPLSDGTWRGWSRILTTDVQTGNVGIGTDTPGHKLEVNGITRTKEVIVTQQNWPDYVFAPGYDLPSLAEVRAFIGANGHLPGIPNAETVHRDGQRVGQTQAALLKKIEELTLYALQQEERAATLETTVEAQDRRIEALEKRYQRELDALKTQVDVLLDRVGTN